MKKIFFLAISISIFISCKTDEDKAVEEALSQKLPTTLVENPRSADNIDTTSLKNLGCLKFDDTLHDFGNMKEGEIVEYEFEFTNTGKKDLIISEAKGSCGCTVPEYSSDPVKPNERGKIKVTFNSKGKMGFNEKSVQITTNGNPSTYQLKINATVN